MVAYGYITWFSILGQIVHIMIGRDDAHIWGDPDIIAYIDLPRSLQEAALPDAATCASMHIARIIDSNKRMNTEVVVGSDAQKAPCQGAQPVKHAGNPHK